MKILKRAAVVTMLGMSFLIASGATIALISLDGLGGLVFGLLGEEDTVYAPGYSDRAFRQVEIGMSQQEVLSLLGEPISPFRLTGEPLMDWSRAFPAEWCWEYSHSPSDSDFRIRCVYIENGKVVGKRAGYWVD
jgi:hypothetical protein